MYELLGDPVNNEINTENHIFIALQWKNKANTT